jgi:EAL domain-containing protein (putative c-di-GMP-specific phosphodiesterase class I)
MVNVAAADIRKGLVRGEFVFHYQPKVAFLTGQVSGAEALLRWQRRDGALVAPEAFMPAAESNGLVPDITQAMFPRLLDDFQRIRGECHESAVALNICAQDLDTPKLRTLVEDAVRSGRINGERLELEITESAVVAGSDATMHSMSSLLTAGIRLAMDDYGMGFSSLDTLNRLPFSTIKLDQSFVLRMLRSAKSATLVKASVAMAQMLGIKTVVEGIESENVYHSLLHCGCTEGQGYWISRPLALQDYLSFLRTDRRWPASPVGMLRMAQLGHSWQHKLLMDEVFAFLRSREKPLLALQGLHMGHRECTLGRWYYSAGQVFRGDPDFDALEKPHRRMHEICGQIFDAIQERSNPQVLEARIEELSDDSSRVSTCLQRLETRLLIGELGS